MLYRASEKILERQGVRMRYISFGVGARPLVLIQGLNTNGIKGAALFLAYAYRTFAKEYRVYLFDRRETLDEGTTVRELARDTATAMDALGLSDADVLGVSLGGMIAEYLAIDRPDLVRRLVLAVTLSKNNRMLSETISKWTELTVDGSFKALVRDMAERMYSEKYRRRYRLLLPLLTFWQRPRDVSRFLALMRVCLTCHAYDELERIKCPTLVIGGRKDRVLSGEASCEIAEKLGCEIFMYESFGHAVYEEAGDFNQRVYEFFNRTSP